LDGNYLGCASERLKGDSELALIAIKTHPNILRSLPNCITDNFQIVSEAIKIDKDSLRFASKRLKSNYEIALNYFTSDKKGYVGCGFYELFSGEILNKLSLAKENPDFVGDFVGHFYKKCAKVMRVKVGNKINFFNIELYDIFIIYDNRSKNKFSNGFIYDNNKKQKIN
jgi:hypothetical protein